MLCVVYKECYNVLYYTHQLYCSRRDLSLGLNRPSVSRARRRLYIKRVWATACAAAHGRRAFPGNLSGYTDRLSAPAVTMYRGSAPGQAPQRGTRLTYSAPRRPRGISTRRLAR
jgi:hypothetical protein